MKQSLKKEDLEAFKGPMSPTHNEAGRSVKSEYDYGSKRKFVDVLGNIDKKHAFHIEKTPDVKEPSQKSRYSKLSR